MKTYPNVQMNFPSKALSSFTKIVSTFAEVSPGVGDYEDAYDIWTNGIATSGSTEVMIWVDTYKQAPAGTKMTTATFDSHAYDVWRTSDGSYLAFVAKSNFTSGSINILGMLQWAMVQGWLPTSATLDQIDFGVEICYTDGAPATWQVTDFSIDATAP